MKEANYFNWIYTGLKQELFERIEEAYDIVVNSPLSTQVAVYISKKLEWDDALVNRPSWWLLKKTQENKSLLVLHESTPIWFITVDIYQNLYKWRKIHERISLWVDPEYRDKSLWKYLMCKLTEMLSEQAIISCTKNPKVWHICKEYLWFKQLPEQQIPQELISILEQGGPITWESYNFYCNVVLQNLIDQEK